MRLVIWLCTLVLWCAGCSSTPKMEGFDREKWLAGLQSCKNSRIELAQTLIENQEQLLGKGQAEIKSFLGQPAENELYRRNQKFFYYNLTPTNDSCNIPLPQRLSIRFDALDRVKEVMIIEHVE